MFLFCSVFKSFEVFYCLMFCVLAFDLLSYEPTNTYICKPNKCITYIHTYIHTHTHHTQTHGADDSAWRNPRSYHRLLHQVRYVRTVLNNPLVNTHFLTLTCTVIVILL